MNRLVHSLLIIALFSNNLYGMLLHKRNHTQSNIAHITPFAGKTHHTHIPQYTIDEYTADKINECNAMPFHDAWHTIAQLPDKIQNKIKNKSLQQNDIHPAFLLSLPIELSAHIFNYVFEDEEITKIFASLPVARGLEKFSYMREKYSKDKKLQTHISLSELYKLPYETTIALHEAVHYFKNSNNRGLPYDINPNQAEALCLLPDTIKNDPLFAEKHFHIINVAPIFSHYFYTALMMAKILNSSNPVELYKYASSLLLNYNAKCSLSLLLYVTSAILNTRSSSLIHDLKSKNAFIEAFTFPLCWALNIPHCMTSIDHAIRPFKHTLHQSEIIGDIVCTAFCQGYTLYFKSKLNIKDEYL